MARVCLSTDGSRFTVRTRPKYLISIKDFSFKHTGGQDGNLAQVKVWLRGGGKRPATKKPTYYSDDKYRYDNTTADVGTDTEPNCFFVHLYYIYIFFSLDFGGFGLLHRVSSLEYLACPRLSLLRRRIKIHFKNKTQVLNPN
jgi:hypothetical protein